MIYSLRHSYTYHLFQVSFSSDQTHQSLFIISSYIHQGLLALLLILMTAFTWVLTSTNVEHSVSSIALKLRSELLFQAGDRVNAVLQGSNASATSLARFLSPLINQDNISSLSYIQNQVSLDIAFLKM